MPPRERAEVHHEEPLILNLNARFHPEPEAFTASEDDQLNTLIRAAYNYEGFSGALDGLAYTPIFDALYANFIAISRRPWSRASVMARLLALRKSGKLVTRATHTRQQRARRT
jgi:hypothetical protein